MLAGPLLLVILAIFAPPVAAIAGDGPSGTEDYFWPKRGGTYIGHGAVPFDAPTDFSKAAWTWDNPEDELFRHGPVIDGKKNVYVATAIGRVQKFSPDGELLWSWRTELSEGRVVTSPFLYKGRLYVSSMGPDSGYSGLVHCFDIESGKRLWVKPVKANGRAWFDSHTVHLAEDVLLGPLVNFTRPWGPEGHNMIFAMNATDGSPLWEFTLDTGNIWNFMPSTPGDGTFFFATTCGRAERRSLADGSKLWASRMPDIPDSFCSTGGATLGPNGVLYAVANNWLVTSEHFPLLANQSECSDLKMKCPGILIAHSAADGKVLWARRLPEPFQGMQYPAVGRIGGRLALVAGVGMNPSLPELKLEKWYPILLGIVMNKLLFHSEAFRRLAGIPNRRNAISAFDAETGEPLWSWEEERWGFWGAKGDEAKYIERLIKSGEDHRVDAICGPDNWGIPAILADGTVVAGSGNTGKLHAIRDANGDGAIQDGEVRTYEFESGFLNGPAFAPGLTAVAPCWGKMHVYRSDSK